jgi:polar amino acid transport system substrate-binding protein
MVPADSLLRSIADVDRPGVRIAVGNGSAYELYLSRTIQNATLVRAPTGREAIELFLREGLDVVAGVKSPLVEYARSRPTLRVMESRFMVIEQAVGIPHGRPTAHHYLSAFVEDAKASGFVAAALERSGQRDALVAPRAG